MKTAEELYQSILDSVMDKIVKDNDPIKTYYGYYISSSGSWHITPVMKGPKGSKCLNVLRCEITEEPLCWPGPYPIVGAVVIASDKKRIKVHEVKPFKDRDYYTLLNSGSVMKPKSEQLDDLFAQCDAIQEQMNTILPQGNDPSMLPAVDCYAWCTLLEQKDALYAQIRTIVINP